jgi:hypothetical protein
MGKGEKQAEVAEPIEELHKQYGHNETTCLQKGIPQVAVSRLRMGNTNITHGYKICDELKPHCEECNQVVTVEYLIWQCAAYNPQKTRNSITKDSVGD